MKKIDDDDRSKAITKIKRDDSFNLELYMQVQFILQKWFDETALWLLLLP